VLFPDDGALSHATAKLDDDGRPLSRALLNSWHEYTLSVIPVNDVDGMRHVSATALRMLPASDAIGRQMCDAFIAAHRARGGQTYRQMTFSQRATNDGQAVTLTIYYTKLNSDIFEYLVRDGVVQPQTWRTQHNP
jgi:hypothetical protein